MSLSMGRLSLSLCVGLVLSVSPAHAQIKSAPPTSQPVPRAAARRFLERVGAANTSGIQSLTLNPDAVYAGQMSTITVELPAPAPAGGATVLLSASPGSAATLERPSITIAAGQTTGTDVVRTTAGGSNATVDISASASGSSGKLSGSLQVLAAPPAISAYSGFPLLVRAGNSVTGTVTIAGPAPAGGVTVPLYTSVSGDAVVPSSVTMPAGQSSAPVTIAAGQKAGKVTLSASAVALAQGCPAAPPCAAIQVATVPAIASFYLMDTTAVQGGRGAAVARIFMTQPSPDPVAVTVSSSNTQVVPASQIQWDKGKDYSSGMAYLNTLPVTAPTSVTITASCAACQGVTTKSATVQVVTALAVSGLTVSPGGDIKGGTQVHATITLNKPAGHGGQTVAMSTSNPICLVPKAFSIPEGQSSATVNVTTQAVAAPTTVTLSAGLMGTNTPVTTTVRVVP